MFYRMTRCDLRHIRTSCHLPFGMCRIYVVRTKVQQRETNPVATITNPLYESKFKAFGVSWTLDDDVLLDSIKQNETTQVRFASEIAPPAQVTLYAVQMEAGETFPPVVLWNGFLIDGNTRIHAMRKAKMASTPAYRIDCRNERQAKQIAAALNQTNGRRLNGDEARRQAVSMMDDGYSDAFVARELGVDATKVRRWRRDQEVVQRADRLGLGTRITEEGLTTRAKLADITHDAPFAAVVEALSTFDVSTDDLNKLINDVKKAQSDDDAVSIVRSRSDDWEPKGTRRQGGQRITAREAYRSITALTNKPVEYWVDLTEAEVALPKWETLERLAANVLAEYRRQRGDDAVAA